MTTNTANSILWLRRRQALGMAAVLVAGVGLLVTACATGWAQPTLQTVTALLFPPPTAAGGAGVISEHGQLPPDGVPWCVKVHGVVGQFWPPDADGRCGEQKP